MKLDSEVGSTDSIFSSLSRSAIAGVEIVAGSAGGTGFEVFKQTGSATWLADGALVMSTAA